MTASLCVGLSDETGGKQCPEAKDLNGEKLLLVCCADVLKNEDPVRVQKSTESRLTQSTVDVIVFILWST